MVDSGYLRELLGKFGEDPGLVYVSKNIREYIIQYNGELVEVVFVVTDDKYQVVMWAYGYSIDIGDPVVIHKLYPVLVDYFSRLTTCKI